ncbi:uncharacterized protein RJT21DRAFT_114679 [Scheffersomyces amazonensis]|uniref:uncharacterized protein n=1 Tax=Scheffersomyces amazonensis TaxID=1078765 RepID=UPI00315D2D4C
MNKVNSVEAESLGVKKRKSTPPISSGQVNNKKVKIEDQPQTQTQTQTRLAYSITPEDKNGNDVEEESVEEIAKQYKKFKNAAKFDLNSEELFCICRKPDNGEMMVQCDGCEEWFHFKCMKLKQENSNLIAKFFCKFCDWQNTGVTLWKRKCRVSWCKDPIRNDSKYCSDEHGKLFMKELLVDKKPITDHDLASNKIKTIMDHSGYNYEVLINLGSQFPELDIVKEYNETNGANIDKFPTETKQELNSIKRRFLKIKQLIEKFEKREAYLLEIKEKNKSLNDKLLRAIYPEVKTEDTTSTSGKKKKSSKSKKLDICFHDKSLDKISTEKSIIDEILTNEDQFNKLKTTIEQKINEESDDVLYNELLCIQDRKKCPRHNGWWNLLNDEVTKKLIEYNQTLDKLEAQKKAALRNYSIEIYDN